jgi:UDP-glucose 4-epimerase
MPRILVTGGLGAIGSAVVRRLVEDGHRPVVFDRQDNVDLIRDIVDSVDVEVGDIRALARLGQAIRRHDVDTVIHMAVLLPVEAQREPEQAISVNTGATAGICELARLLDLRRVVFASSKGVYRRVVGDYAHPTYRPVDESYPIGPDDMYDITKYAAEQTGLVYHRAYGVDFVALRFAATYGPGRMARHGDLAIRSAIIENAFFGRPTTLARGGDQQDDFVYTKDVAQAMVKAAFATDLRDRIFNIGTGAPSTLSAAAEILRREIPGAAIHIGPGTDYGTGQGRYCVFDISRAREQLGYEPEYDHEHGILDYLGTLSRAFPDQAAAQGRPILTTGARSPA